MRRETGGSPASEKKLEQYGVWVKAGPREVPRSAGGDEPLELSDLETTQDAEAALPDITDESPLTSEEEKLLDELETELEPATSDDTELPELDLESSGLADEVEVTLSDSLPAEEHFDDLQALEDELASVTSAAGGTAGKGQSDAILARIEEELRSIRTDLTELKKELSGLRKPAAKPKAAQPGADEESPGVFFDEDEDETIALTGDELDNILNTAEITEEAAELSVDALAVAQPEEAEALALPGAEGAFPSGAEGALASGEAGRADDILSYETPILEEDRLTPAHDGGDEELAELEVEPEEAGEADMDLAADLVLETVAQPKPSAKPAKPAVGLADPLADLELEGLPEIELEEEAGQPAEIGGAVGVAEPAEMESVADLEDVTDLEAVTDLETVTDLEGIAEMEAATEPAGTTDEVDLEALALEAQEPGDALALDLDSDLDIAELEAVPDEKDKEIEIDFEADTAQAAGPTAKSARPAAKTSEPLDEMLEVEEVEDIEAAPGPSPAPAAPPRHERPSAGSVPDDLKDEIRAVLKYMDHLLEALPEAKIQEFAGSDYFVMYKKLFEELGLGE